MHCINQCRCVWGEVWNGLCGGGDVVYESVEGLEGAEAGMHLLTFMRVYQSCDLSWCGVFTWDLDLDLDLDTHPHSLLCRLLCSGHGECWLGFCKCHPGYYGTDCMRKMAGAALDKGGEGSVGGGGHSGTD